MTVDCILGELPEERIKAQRIVVDVELAFDATPAAHSADLARTIDYARLEKELRFILTEARFRLVESAALALAQWLLLPPLGVEPTATRVRVTLAKPAALGGGAIPSIVVDRSTADFTVRVGAPATNKEIAVFTCPDAAIRRIHGDPSAWKRDAAYKHAKDASLYSGVIVRVMRG
jgi:dihydroneopterin aldolase